MPEAIPGEIEVAFGEEVFVFDWGEGVGVADRASGDHIAVPGCADGDAQVAAVPEEDLVFIPSGADQAGAFVVLPDAEENDHEDQAHDEDREEEILQDFEKRFHRREIRLSKSPTMAGR